MKIRKYFVKDIINEDALVQWKDFINEDALVHCKGHN